MTRNEAYFPYIDTSAQDEARRASRAANENRERLAEIENEQQRHFSSQEGAIQSLRNSVGTMSRVIGDLEHRIEVLFKKDEKQTINVQSLQGQTSELASVVVDLAARLETSQEVQKEVVECLVQMREALISIAEHVAAMEAGGKEVMKVVEGILADELDGRLQKAKEGEESVGLPWKTVEFMKAVDRLCLKFRIYDEDSERVFDFSTIPPRVQPEFHEEFENSPSREHDLHFANNFHGQISESQFREFLCETIRGRGLVAGQRIFDREYTKNTYNEIVEMACDAIIQNRQTQTDEAGAHPA